MNISTPVPKPNPVVQEFTVKAKNNVNMRFGPDVVYDKITGLGRPPEILRDDVVHFVKPTTDDGKGRLWVWGIRRARKDDDHDLTGWFSLSDLNHDILDKTATQPAQVVKLPPERPADAPASDLKPAAVTIPEPPPNPEKSLNIAIRHGDAGLLNITITADDPAVLEMVVSTLQALRIIGRALAHWPDTLSKTEVLISGGVP